MPLHDFPGGSANNRFAMNIVGDEISLVEVKHVEYAVIPDNEYTYATGILATWWDSNKPSWWSDAPKLIRNFMHLIIGAVDELLSNNNSSFGTVINDYLNDATDGLSSIKSKVVDAYDKIETGINSRLDNATNGLSAIKTKVVDAYDKIETGINSKLEDASTGLSAIKTKVVDAYDKIETGINDKLEDATNGLTAIKGKVVDAYDKIETGINTRLDDASNGLAAIKSRITNEVETALNQAKAIVDNWNLFDAQGKFNAWQFLSDTLFGYVEKVLDDLIAAQGS